MFNYHTLKATLEGGVAHIQLNRPDKANSLDGTMWRDLRCAFDELDSTSAVRAVVLGGVGNHFSTGIDLNFLVSLQQELKQLSQGHRQERVRHFITELQDSVNAIENCRKPVLAAIHGLCMGAGVDIISACDMRYATGAARFSIKEVDMAIVADVGTLQRLSPIVGEGIARELAFTGRIFKGEEAKSMGFVNGLFESKRALEEGVSALANDLSEKSPLTIRGIKETMNYSRDHTVAEGLNYGAMRNAGMLLSRDLEEAVTAFFEKRAPQYEDE
jgi:enoyl-CoA hydratase